MSPRIAPIPVGAGEPLSLMHNACFPDDPWDAGAFAQILSLHGVFGYVAWCGETPAGFAIARDLGGEAEILTIGVLPRMRRRGLGRALLVAIVAQAGERRCGSVVLEVAADNPAARLLYESAGFIRVGTRPHYYRRSRDRIEALILRLPVEAAPNGAESKDSLR
jgi:ribosomal-protein-alanine N-acetyltransferase